jgi:SAM-dependent methyltransferase
MFFPERIRSIGSNDTVLEIGPGGNPHPRADVFLEKRFDDRTVAERQRAFTPPLKISKEIVFYEGGRFPFHDKQFDYIICSHVLEHVEDIDAFLGEISRVGHRGYLEYPTIYYDYVYNFPEHITLVLQRNDVLYWMPKAETELDRFQCVQNFFYESLRQGYTAMVDELRSFLFQGFEWEGRIDSQRAFSLEQVNYTAEELQFATQLKENSQRKLEGGLLATLVKFLSRIKE